MSAVSAKAAFLIVGARERRVLTPWIVRAADAMVKAVAPRPVDVIVDDPQRGVQTRCRADTSTIR